MEQSDEDEKVPWLERATNFFPFQKLRKWKENKYREKILRYFPEITKGELQNKIYEKDARIVKLCVVGNLIFAGIVLFLPVPKNISIEEFPVGILPELWWCLLVLVLLWFVVRILDIFVYQFYVLFVAPFKKGKKYAIKSVPRIVTLAFLNYFEILFCFAIFYRNLYFLFQNPDIMLQPSHSLYFSVVTMSTLGYGDITPSHWFGMFLVSIQTLVGILIAFVIIARFVTQLPKHRTLKGIEQEIEILKLRYKNREISQEVFDEMVKNILSKEEYEEMKKDMLRQTERMNKNTINKK